MGGGGDSVPFPPEAVNTPPPKGGGFVLRLKSAIPAEAGLFPAQAGSRRRRLFLVDAEDFITVVDLLFDVSLDHFVGDIATSATEVEVASKIAKAACCHAEQSEASRLCRSGIECRWT